MDVWAPRLIRRAGWSAESRAREMWMSGNMSVCDCVCVCVCVSAALLSSHNHWSCHHSIRSFCPCQENWQNWRWLVILGILTPWSCLKIRSNKTNDLSCVLHEGIQMPLMVVFQVFLGSDEPVSPVQMRLTVRWVIRFRIVLCWLECVAFCCTGFNRSRR